METLDDLDRYLDPGLQLTVKGKVYTVPLPSAALGVWCRRVVQTAGEVTAAATDEELRAVAERTAARAETMPPLPNPHLSFEEQMLGSAYAELLADEVADPYVQFCAQ